MPLIHALVCLIALALSPDTQPPVERRTGDALRNVRGNFANLYAPTCSAWNRGFIYTPALAGAPTAVRDCWLGVLRDNGTTHVHLGPFDGGPIYPGVPWSNPDWRVDPAALRAFVELLLSTPAADGKGFTPILTLHGGAARPQADIDRWWPVFAKALDGLQPFVIYRPAWEPVAGKWRSSELAYAACRAKPLFGETSHWFVHLSPGRMAGSSDPIEADDPWRGQPDAFYRSHCGEIFEGLMFQTDHGAAVLTSCGADDGRCWVRSWADAVAAAGVTHGRWVILDETVAYDAFHRPDPELSLVAERIAAEAASICRARGVVKCGFGNGVPETR